MNYIICPECGKKDVPDTLKKCPECNYVFNVPAEIPAEDQVAADVSSSQALVHAKPLKKNKLPLILGIAIGVIVLAAAAIFALLKINVIGETRYPNIGISLNDLIENSDGQYQISDFSKGVGNYTYLYHGADGRGRIVADTDSEKSPMRSITFVWDLESATFNAVGKDKRGLLLVTVLSADLDRLFPTAEPTLESFNDSLATASNLLKNGVDAYHGQRVSLDINDGEVYCTVSPIETDLTESDMKERSYFSEFPRLPTPNDYAEITKVDSDNEYNYYTYLPSEDLDEAFKKFGDYATYIEQKGFIVKDIGTNDYPILNGNGSQIANLSLKKKGDKCLFVISLKR